MKQIKATIISKVTATDHRLQPSEVAREISSELGVPSKKVKRAMNELVFEGKLEFTYYGTSYIELPLEMSKTKPARDKSRDN